MNDSPKPKSRWMSTLLIVSLALNLLVVGVAVGTALRIKGDHKGSPGFGSALYRALPKEDRKALRGELFERHKARRQTRSQDFSQLDAALRAIPFDPVAVQLVLDQQAQAMVDLQGALQAQWLLHITSMSDDERQSYADRLDEVVTKGPRKHHKK